MIVRHILSDRIPEFNGYYKMLVIIGMWGFGHQVLYVVECRCMLWEWARMPAWWVEMWIVSPLEFSRSRRRVAIDELVGLEVAMVKRSLEKRWC